MDDRTRRGNQYHDIAGNPYLDNLDVEKHNVTVPGEGELVQATRSSDGQLSPKGQKLLCHPPAANGKQTEAYYGPNGLLELFKQIKDVSGQILHLNQNNMEQASADARRLAKLSSIGFAVALAVASVLAGFAALAYGAHNFAARAGDDARGAGDQRGQPQSDRPLSFATMSWASWPKPSIR